MNVVRFCRRSLTALPVFLVFMACDQLLPTAGNGVDIPVKIRAVRVAGGSQTEITTRASGGERRIVDQPIIQDLGDGMLAEITVEEDVEALRKGDRSLTTNAWFRIIAIENSSGHYLSHADFQAKTSGEYTSASLRVPSGVKCDFICFSYNSTTVDLPQANYTVDVVLPTHTMDGSTDFLYQRLTEQVISAENSSLSFDDLKHQLAKVTLIFDTSYNNWPITAVNSNALPTIGSVAIPNSFTLTNDTPPSGVAATQTPAGWPATFGLDQTEAISGELRVVPKATSSITLTIPAGAVTLSGPSTALQPTVKKTYTITTALEKGKSYIVRLKPYAPKFAGSNIYWDDSDQDDPSNHKLTFEPHNGSNTNHVNYQGVFFKWGSLIGISPAQLSGSEEFSSGTAASSGQTDGTPIYLKKPDGNWVKTNVAYATYEGDGKERWFGDSSVGDNVSGSNGAWSPIPYQNSTSISAGEDAHSLLTNPDFEHYKGDICSYIDENYRMPTRNELVALGTGDSGNGKYTGFTYSYITNQTADGKKVFSTTFGTFTGLKAATNITYYLPASGYRVYNSGWLNPVGTGGLHWSGSASSTEKAHSLFFGTSSAYTDGYTRSYGFPVRCVLN